MYRLSLSILGQPADAEDAVQEVFLRVFDKADSFAGRSAVGTWVYRLTVNACLNLRRKRLKQPLALVEDAEALPAPFPAAAKSAETSELHARLHDVLRGLPEEARLVLTLREIEGLSYAEIADVLEVPQGTVMSRLSRARKRLTAEVQRDAQAFGEEPPGQPENTP